MNKNKPALRSLQFSPEQRKMVEEKVMWLALSGMSDTEIVDKLISCGIRTPRGDPLNIASVKLIIARHLLNKNSP